MATMLHYRIAVQNNHCPGLFLLQFTIVYLLVSVSFFSGLNFLIAQKSRLKNLKRLFCKNDNSTVQLPGEIE